MKLGYKLDKTCEYNMALLEGIIAAQNNQFDEAISKFKMCSVGHESFGDPKIYCGLTKICEYNRTPKCKNKELLKEALFYISESLEKEENSNTYYIAAAILF